ncbi:unnamed protein product [Hyaloperonospora brassicae]|uniref:Myb/SANT-like domain-containing protein n=1 Tax=Hyaloperonospora brassicae TaxID=162125 RepID=A0AAV0U9X0_HYABA|nr:unnamed protein product [Hyaloperonospora brassicae]
MSDELTFHRRGGRVRGAEGYRSDDVRSLLACVKKYLPTTAEEWNLVLEEYHRTHATPNARARRDSCTLKAKFMNLARYTQCGESTRCDMAEAKAVLKLIQSKMVDTKCLQRRGGRPQGAQGYSAADSQALLQTIQRILPVSRQDWDLVADEYCRGYAIPHDRRSRGGHALERKYRKWLKAGSKGVEQDEASLALAVKAQIGAKALKKKRTTLSEDLRTKNVIVVTTRSNMKIIKAGGRRETVIAGEVENGEEDVHVANLIEHLIAKYDDALGVSTTGGITKRLAVGWGTGLMYDTVVCTYTGGMYFGGLMVANDYLDGNNVRSWAATTSDKCSRFFFAIIIGAMALGQTAPSAEVFT